MTTRLVLGADPGSTGIYNLNGGLLQASTVSLGLGSGTFTFGGGTLQATGSFANVLSFQFNTNATIDTNNYTVTLSGSLYGSGGLTKTDSGALILSGTNPFTYSGSTTVSGGTLQVQAPICCPVIAPPAMSRWRPAPC